MIHIRNSKPNSIFLLEHEGIPTGILTDFNETIIDGSICVDVTNQNLYILKGGIWTAISGGGTNGGITIPNAYNGLTSSSSGYKLGGTFSENTVINANGYTFTINNGNFLNIDFTQDVSIKGGNVKINSGSNGNFTNLRTDLLTNDRTYQYPDKNGTLSLKEDLISATSGLWNSLNNLIIPNSTTAGNGLTMADDNKTVKLGGNLTENTVINGTNFDLTLNVNDFIVNASTNTIILKSNNSENFKINNNGVIISSYNNIKMRTNNTDRFNIYPDGLTTHNGTSGNSGVVRMKTLQILDNNLNSYKKAFNSISNDKLQIAQDFLSTRFGTSNNIEITPSIGNISFNNINASITSNSFPLTISSNSIKLVSNAGGSNGIIINNSSFTSDRTYSFRNYSGTVSTVSKPIITQNISGSVVVDLSLGEYFEFTITGNVTSFSFINETVGTQYLFYFIKNTTNKTFTWATGKYRFPFGNAPILTDPTTNGSSPAKSVDIISTMCGIAGRLDIVFTPDLIEN